MQKQSVLIGPYWFILYTEFFAILSLVFYVLENPDKTGTTEILADARAGRDVIGALAQRSLAADRITTALKVGRSTKRFVVAAWLMVISLYSNSSRSGLRKEGVGQYRLKRGRPPLQDPRRELCLCQPVQGCMIACLSGGQRSLIERVGLFGEKCRERPSARLSIRLECSPTACLAKASREIFAT